MPFRLEHITTQMRVELGCTLVARSGEYGLLTRLARGHGVSRQFLYDLKERTEEAIQAALAPRPLGRRAVERCLRVDALALKRAILVLSQAAQASVRAIGECLEEILGVRLSVGMIHGVLKEAASRARALPAPVPESPIDVEADELYAAGKPVLEVVQSASGLVLVLDCAEAADETTWGLTWLELLEERAVKVSGVVADGARGLRAGLREAQGMGASLDHWHTLRDLGRIERSLEKKAYRRLETLERARCEAEALRHQLHHGRRPKPGRPKQVATDPSSMQAAKSAAEEAVARYDQTHFVLEVVREVLHPVDVRTGRVRTSREVGDELKAAWCLLKELGAGAQRAAKLLEERAGDLVSYLDRLQATLAEQQQQHRVVLSEEDISFLAWAWCHRRALGLEEAADAWPASPEAARAVWGALESVVRSSGMVENLGSVLAAHRASHRGLPSCVLSVFKVYRNHRVFERGKRAGQSPLQLAGLRSPHWLDALGYGRIFSVQKERQPVLTSHPQSVNTLAA
jgi:hypothetical protein